MSEGGGACRVRLEVLEKLRKLLVDVHTDALDVLHGCLLIDESLFAF